MPTQNIKVGQWTIIASVDDDGHLSTFISHEDGSEVFATDSDIGKEDEWAERFTTQAIEDAYSHESAYPELLKP